MATTRRQFFLGTAAVAGAGAGFFGARLMDYLNAPPEAPYRTLTPEEAEQLGALADELIPPDPPAEWNGWRGIPGGREANTVRFLDWHLAPNEAFAHQRDDYREHLARARGRTAAEIEKDDRPFFDTLLRHVKMAYYGNPRYGGNAGYASFRMLGLSGPTATGRDIPPSSSPAPGTKH